MLIRLVLACTITCTAFAVSPEDGGGGSLIQCGSNGGPGCATEARRWWRDAPRHGGHRPRIRPVGGEGPRCTTAPADAPAGASGSGRWMVLTCPGRSALLIRDAGPEQGGARGAPAITPVMVALMARDRFVLPVPGIGSSPKPEDPQLVRLPVWLAVSTSQWRPYTASATAGGITATATARPTTVTWRMGDGGTVICRGPGTHYRDGKDDPRKPSPTCGHTYLESSATAPNATYRVTATITWGITWTAGGQSGALPPLTTTASTGFRVAESQAIVTA